MGYFLLPGYACFCAAWRMRRAFSYRTDDTCQNRRHDINALFQPCCAPFSMWKALFLLFSEVRSPTKVTVTRLERGSNAGSERRGGQSDRHIFGVTIRAKIQIGRWETSSRELKLEALTSEKLSSNNPCVHSANHPFIV